MRHLLLCLIPLLLSKTGDAAPAAAEAPTAAVPPQETLTTLIARKGCKAFAGLLATTGDAAATFEGNVGGGLTVFCPADGAIEAFLFKFKNLTADDKLSLLLYHGVPVYYSAVALKSNNGAMNTLATNGASNDYNFIVQNDGDKVTLKTKLTVARVTNTLFDKDPLAVHAIDEVLEPAELFKPAEVPAPAPEPSAAPAADAPKPAGKAAAKSHGKTSSPPALADSPDEKPADQKAANANAGSRRRSIGSLVIGAAMGAAAAALFVVA